MKRGRTPKAKVVSPVPEMPSAPRRRPLPLKTDSRLTGQARLLHTPREQGTYHRTLNLHGHVYGECVPTCRSAGCLDGYPSFLFLCRLGVLYPANTLIQVSLCTGADDLANPREEDFGTCMYILLGFNLPSTTATRFSSPRRVLTGVKCGRRAVPLRELEGARNGSCS